MARRNKRHKNPRKRWGGIVKTISGNKPGASGSRRFALFDEVSLKASKNATKSVTKSARPVSSWVTDAEIADVMRGPCDNRGAKSGYIPYQEIACDRRVRDEENRRRGFDNRLKQFYQQSGFKLVDGELDVK